MAPRTRKPPPPPASAVVGSQREAAVSWFKDRIATLEQEFQTRIDILRTVGEHPSPIFANQVREHALLGLEPKYIAKLLCVSEATIKLYYPDELDIGKAVALTAIARNMFRIATSETDPNNAKVGMTMLEKRGGAEFAPATKKIEVEDTTKQAPIIDSSKLSFEDRQALRQIFERAVHGEPAALEQDDSEQVVE